MCVYTLNFSFMRNHDIFKLCIWLVSLNILFSGCTDFPMNASSLTFHVAVWYSFLHKYWIFFIHSSVDEGIQAVLNSSLKIWTSMNLGNIYPCHVMILTIWRRYVEAGLLNEMNFYFWLFSWFSSLYSICSSLHSQYVIEDFHLTYLLTSIC